MKKSRGTHFRCIIFDFARICEQTVGSRNERITNALAAHQELLSSVKILVEWIMGLKSKILGAAAAEKAPAASRKHSR